MKRTVVSARSVAEIGLVAAAYAVLTWLVAPISYGQIQFRLSEILKPLVIWDPRFIPAFVLGNFLIRMGARIPYPVVVGIEDPLEDDFALSTVPAG